MKKSNLVAKLTNTFQMSEANINSKQPELLD